MQMNHSLDQTWIVELVAKCLLTGRSTVEH